MIKITTKIVVLGHTRDRVSADIVLQREIERESERESARARARERASEREGGRSGEGIGFERGGCQIVRTWCDKAHKILFAKAHK